MLAYGFWEEPPLHPQQLPSPKVRSGLDCPIIALNPQKVLPQFSAFFDFYPSIPPLFTVFAEFPGFGETAD
jgi:hypothetical protein